MAEFMRLCAFANSSKSSVGLLAAIRRPDWRQARHRFAMARDRYFLALFDEIEQLAEFVLCLKGADFPHKTLPISWPELAYQLLKAISMLFCATSFEPA
jgi:hypothetical protein